MKKVAKKAVPAKGKPKAAAAKGKAKEKAGTPPFKSVDDMVAFRKKKYGA